MNDNFASHLSKQASADGREGVRHVVHARRQHLHHHQPERLLGSVEITPGMIDLLSEGLAVTTEVYDSETSPFLVKPLGVGACGKGPREGNEGVDGTTTTEGKARGEEGDNATGSSGAGADADAGENEGPKIGGGETAKYSDFMVS